MIGTNLPDPAGGFGATSLTGTYDAQDRQLSYGACTYNHTANGERTTKTCGAQVTTHHYDIHGNLTRVERTGAPTIDYLIDGRGRRVGKQADGQWVERFLYAGQLEPVAKLDDQGRVIERYHYAERGQTPSLIVKHDGATPQAYRVIADHLGSVRLVVRLSDGQVVQRLDYDAFGAITLDTNPGFQPFGFVGGLQDRDTGLVRFGARDYDPATGRWVSKEPLGFGGALNWYEYAGGDPVNWVDLDGRFTISLGPSIRLPRWAMRMFNGDGQGGSVGIAIQLTRNGRLSLDIGAYGSLNGGGEDWGTGRYTLDLGFQKDGVVDMAGSGAELGGQFKPFGGTILFDENDYIQGGQFSFGAGYNIGGSGTLTGVYSLRYGWAPSDRTIPIDSECEEIY